MPTNTPWYRQKKRDTGKTNYETYTWTKKAIKKRVWRNKARRTALKKGIVKKWDTMEMHHIDGDPTNNSKWNVKKITRKSNHKMWAAKATRVKKSKGPDLFYV